MALGRVTPSTRWWSVAACTLVISLVHAQGDVALQRGIEALHAKRWAEARAALEQATRNAPQAAEAWFRLGLACAGQEDWDAAVDAYTRAIEIDPRHVKAQNNLANVQFRRGDFPAAERAYRRAVEIDPNYLFGHYHLGWVLRQLDRPQAAEEAFQRCVSLPARSDRQRATQIECSYYIGTLRFRAGDWSAAAQLLEQVLTVNPRHPEARHYLGLAYRHLGRLQDARRELETHRQNLRAAQPQATISREEEP